MATTRRIPERLKQLRLARRLSLAALAARAAVSKSMISKIERGEVNPSAAVLGRLADALDTGISDLLGQHDTRELVVLRQAQQPVFREQGSGFERRAVSPIFPNRGIDVVRNTLPPGASTGTFVGHRRGVDEYVLVLHGRLRAHIGEQAVDLDAGDSLYFEADVDHRFENLGNKDCAWILVIDGNGMRDPR